MQIKGIIFDVDGVIVNSEKTHWRAYKKVLERYNFDLSYDDYKKYFSGKSIRGGILYLLQDFPKLQQGDLESFIEKISTAKINCTVEIFKQSIDFYPDTLNFIQKVHEGMCSLKNIGAIISQPIFAMATGLEKVLVDEILQYYNLRKIFQVIISSDQYTHSKPNPDCFIQALRAMKLKASEVIGIEDSVAGVEALNRTGIYSIAVTNTNTDRLSTASQITNSLMDIVI